MKFMYVYIYIWNAWNHWLKKENPVDCIFFEIRVTWSIPLRKHFSLLFFFLVRVASSIQKREKCFPFLLESTVRKADSENRSLMYNLKNGNCLLLTPLFWIIKLCVLLWSVGALVGALVGGWVGGLVGGWVGWWVGEWVGGLVGRLVGWLVDWFSFS